MANTKSFQFVGGPINNPDDALELFSALGQAASAWARLEQQIDAVLIQINKEAFSATLYNKDHPVSFSSKIGLLKKWFNQHAALEDLTKDVRELTSRLKPLSKKRNVLLHSILESFDAERGTAIFKSVKYEGSDEFTITDYSVPLGDIRVFTDLVNLSNEFLFNAIASPLFSHKLLERFQKPE